jgi:ABC-type sugar transport system permease subunit
LSLDSTKPETPSAIAAQRRSLGIAPGRRKASLFDQASFLLPALLFTLLVFVLPLAITFTWSVLDPAIVGFISGNYGDFFAASNCARTSAAPWRFQLLWPRSRPSSVTLSPIG